MNDFLDIILSVVVFLSPHDVKAIQLWPYAADSSSEKRELLLTFRREGDRWVGDNWQSITMAGGRLLGAQREVLVDLNNDLKVIKGTSYALKPKDWNHPLEFSWRGGTDERVISIHDGTNVTRVIRVKLWKTDPPVEFAFCGPQRTNDLAVLQEKLRAEQIHCTEIRSAPKAVSFGFSVDPKDFNRARTAAAKMISENALSVNVQNSTNGSGHEVFENGKKTGEVHF